MTESAYLANLLYVPSALVSPQHLHAYTYRVENTVHLAQSHLPPTCEHCKLWGLKWRKKGSLKVTCSDIGYNLTDTCNAYRPLTQRVKEQQEYATWGKTDNEEYYTFPRGDLSKLDRTFRGINIVDMRKAPALPFKLDMVFTLRPDQQQAADAWLRCGYGIVNAYTGWGKSVVLSHIVAELGMCTIVFAQEVRHLQVVEEGLREATNLNDVEKEMGTVLCGVYGQQSKIKANGQRYTVSKPGTIYPITLATYQSFTNPAGKKALPLLRDRFGLVAHEEVHHEAAETFHEVTRSFNPYYRMGQSATVTRGDKLHFVTFDTIGPVTALVKDSSPVKPHAKFIHTNVPVPDSCFRFQYPLATIMSFLSSNRIFYETVLENILEDLKAGRRILVFSERTAFIAKLFNSLRLSGFTAEIVQGGKGSKAKIKPQSEYNDALLDGTLNIILATKVMQENYNIPALDCVHLPFPNFSAEKEEQIVGRILRTNVKDKPRPLIRAYTWTADKDLAAACYHWRKGFYTRMGYEIEDAGYAANVDQLSADPDL